MKDRYPRAQLACALLGVVFAFSTVNAEAANNIDVEIRNVIQAQQDAWNRGDIEAFMNGYSRSAETTFVSGDEITRGWQTVLDRYKKKYSDREKMGVLTFSDLEITPLSADSAVATGRWELRRKDDKPHGRFTLIFRKISEGWRIVHDHTSAGN